MNREIRLTFKTFTEYSFRKATENTCVYPEKEEKKHLDAWPKSELDYKEKVERIETKIQILHHKETYKAKNDSMHDEFIIKSIII